jgi:hypothetical protein
VLRRRHGRRVYSLQRIDRARGFFDLGGGRPFRLFALLEFAGDFVAFLFGGLVLFCSFLRSAS